MSYLLITKERASGAQVLLVAPRGADPFRYIGRGESLLCVARVASNAVIDRPCKSGAAAVLAH